ncbi:hypothetical protein AB0M20_10290 [Actinoplanes sp. NPDC051633]|uniref:hypothetical protein n=1 Tax=Actinoplanes sp. NPDC051633 TaxID=3155670 RepID=UPI00342F1995
MLTAVLAVLILVPAGILFIRVWQQNEDDRSDTKLEQQGVEYLAGLSPLISALAEAQSAAIQGSAEAPASLTAAVTRMGAIDQRLGDTLSTRERWTSLRDTIGRLPAVKGEKTQIFQAHVEVSALALALARAAAENSTLSRDPDTDLAHLQQALAVDLMDTVIQVSRMGDLSLLVAGISGSATEKAQAQAVLLPQFGAAVNQVNADVAGLTDNLQAAVDDTTSVTLSGSLVSTVDAFRRGVESFVRGASPATTLTGSGQPQPAAMATAQSQLQTSLASLSGVLVREMGGLLDARSDRLDTRRLEAIVVAAALVLLVLAVILLATVGRRRRAADSADDEALSALPDAPDPFARSSLEPPYGAEVGSNRRERSGAVR